MEEKKEKKKILTTKRIALFSMIVTLVSFVYKFGLGIASLSIILMVASISTFLVLLCKFVFFRNLSSSKEEKKKAYFIIMIASLAFGVVFLLFAVLKVGNIDIHKENNFSGILSYIFIGFVILMFVLSIINLKGALAKDDLVLLGLKEMIFISALTDAVIIEEFLYKTLKSFRRLPLMPLINSYFPLIVAVVMLAVPVLMFKRYRSYGTEKESKETE